jgi:hypothetical protein
MCRSGPCALDKFLGSADLRHRANQKVHRSGALFFADKLSRHVFIEHIVFRLMFSGVDESAAHCFNRVTSLGE